MVIDKAKNTQCNIIINANTLEQVTQYRYLGSCITEDGRCDLDVKTQTGTFGKRRVLEK